MDIKSIDLVHTNPSMGPHEVVRTISLSVTPQNQEAIKKFVHETTIFDGMTLVDYIQGVAQQDAKVLSRVRQSLESFDSSKLNQGQTISKLHFFLKHGQTVSLDDLRYYNFTGRQNGFLKFIADHGTVSDQSAKTRSPNDFPIKE